MPNGYVAAYPDEQVSSMDACSYCGREHDADYAGNCIGCGAPRRKQQRLPRQTEYLDITRLCSKEREYLKVERTARTAPYIPQPRPIQKGCDDAALALYTVLWAACAAVATALVITYALF
jgi:hypothetical protein